MLSAGLVSRNSTNSIKDSISSDITSTIAAVDDANVAAYNAAQNASSAKTIVYPLGYYQNLERLFYFKNTKDSDTVVFDVFAGMTPLWDFGKAVCHLLVYASSLRLAGAVASTTKKSAQSQLANVQAFQNKVASVQTWMEKVNNTMPTQTNSTATVNAPVSFPYPISYYIKTANMILDKYNSWLQSVIDADGTIDDAKFKSLIKNTSEPISWLFQACVSVIARRTVTGLLQIRNEVGLDAWSKMTVVQANDVVDIATSTDVNARGLAKHAGNTANIFRSVLTSTNWNERYFIFSVSSATFADIEALAFDPYFMQQMTGDFSAGVMSDSLKTSLNNPSAALMPDFTAAHSKVASSKCPWFNASTSTDAKTKCPFAGLT